MSENGCHCGLASRVVRWLWARADILAPVSVAAAAAAVGGFRLWEAPPLLQGPDAGSWMEAVLGLRDNGELPELASRGPLFPLLVLAGSWVSGLEDLVLVAHWLNLLAYLIAFCCLYLLARKLLGCEVALAGTMAAILCPPWHWTCLRFNAESLSVTLATASWLVGWLAIRRRDLRLLAVLGLLLAVFLFTHLMAVGFILLHLVAAFGWHRGRQRLLAPLCTLATVAFWAVLIDLLLVGIWDSRLRSWSVGGLSLFVDLLLAEDAWALGQLPGLQPVWEHTVGLLRLLSCAPEWADHGGWLVAAVGLAAVVVGSGLGSRGGSASSPSPRLFLLLAASPTLGHVLIRPLEHYLSPLVPLLVMSVVAGWVGLGRTLLKGLEHQATGGGVNRRWLPAVAATGWTVLALWAAMVHAQQPAMPRDESVVLEMEVAAWVNEKLPAEAIVATNSPEVTLRLKVRTERLLPRELPSTWGNQSYLMLLRESLSRRFAANADAIYLLCFLARMRPETRAIWEEVVDQRQVMPHLHLVAHWPGVRGRVLLWRWDESRQAR